MDSCESPPTAPAKRVCMALIPGYNVRKAAQVVAFFAIRQGGRINVLKLSKLVYLSDRAFVEKYDVPILYDKLVSMQHGPVNSLTLDFVKGFLSDAVNWDEFVSDLDRHDVGLSRDDLRVEHLDELSDAEITTLEAIWAAFGHMSQYEIRDYTHAHCPEWEDPDGSAKPIEYKRLLECLHKDPAIADLIDEDRALANALR